MTQASIPSNREDARKQIEQQLSRLQIVDGVRRAALPIAALGAGIGIFVAPVFPIAAGAAAAVVGLGELFARSQRKILDEQIKNFELKYGTNEGATYSSSANTFTVGGGS
jgi:hypothetical protein